MTIRFDPNARIEPSDIAIRRWREQCARDRRKPPMTISFFLFLVLCAAIAATFVWWLTA